MKLPFAVLGLAAVAWPSSDWAHAVIIRSGPAAGSRVPGPVLDFRLQYNSRVDAERSSLVLDLPDCHTRPPSLRAAASLDMQPRRAGGLTPGAYRRHRQVLSVDGHVTRGDIPFEATAPET